MTDSIIDRLQAVSRHETCSALVGELLGALSADAASLSAGTDIDDTLFSDPFPLLSVLPPLLAKPDCLPADADAIKACLDLVVANSSPREVVTALDAQLASIGGDGEADGSDVDSSDDDEHAGSPGPEEGDSSLELGLLIRLYAKALPRVKTASPEKFLPGASEAITKSLQKLEDGGAFEGPSAGAAAECCLAAVASFVRELGASAWAQKSSEICNELLRQLLGTAVLTLHRALPTDIAQSFFLSKYPRYRIPGRRVDIPPSHLRAWRETTDAVVSLSLTADILINTSITSAPQSTDPATSLGLFVLLTHSLAALPTSTPQSLIPTHSPSGLLQKTLPILALALSGGRNGAAQIGEDEALFWAWWCVEGAVRGSDATGVEEEVLFPLVELLSTVSALSPNPTTRFLAFRLLHTIIIDGTSQEETQIMLLKDLVEDCPFEAMRVAALGLLQDFLVHKFQAPLQPSLFLSPLLLIELGPSFLQHTPTSLFSSPPPLEEFLESHASLVSRKLSLAYFLVSRDATNLTGIKSASTLEKLKIDFVSPLRDQVEEWRQSGEIQDGRVLMELELLNDALERLESVMR